jgi:hypothetical protein
MPYTSFTLRKTSDGSNLRKNAAIDGALRSDGIPVENVALFTTGVNTFSANTLSQGSVRLSWTLEESLASTSIGPVVPTELRIVSSFSGEPVTLRDGTTIQTITAQTATDTYIDTPIVQQGRWVYYSLFVKYSNTTDYWYERVATLYIQIPINYGSVEGIWQHIPEYYKLLDYAQPDLENGYTPLYAFLELIGNEVDRTRTLIESVALSNDPELAVTPALQQLAKEVGLEITTDDLGTSKVRALLNNIGTLRQQKGTISNICSYISALTGCRVEYEYNGALAKPHVFNIYAQRINFISDPEFVDTTITATTATVTKGGSTVYAQRYLTNTWGVVVYGSDVISASSPSVGAAGGGLVNLNNSIQIEMPSGSYANRTVLVYPRIPFPYLGTELYGTSYDYSSTSGASFSELHTATNTVRTTWETTTTWPASLFADSAWITGLKYTFNSLSYRPSLEYTPSTTGASATVSSVPVLVFTMPPGSSITVGSWLFEPTTDGSYFSGNTREGGFIPVVAGALGTGTFDYYWQTDIGGKDNSYSFYLSDHERTIKTTERVIGQYIVPVTMVEDYTLEWDYYSGK